MTGKFIMVASSKGGVGKSTCALGVSRALAGQGYRVLIADLDFGNACLDILLGVQDSVLCTIVDVAQGRAPVEKALIKIEDTQTGSKRKNKNKKGIEKPDGELWLMPCAFGEVARAYALGNSDPLESIDVFRALKDASDRIGADYVILDTGAGVNNAVTIAASIADSALVVTGQMPVALRSAQSTVSALSDLGVKEIKLIINSFDAEGVIEDDRRGLFTVIDESRAVLAGVVPYDYSLMLTHERLLSSGGEAEIAFSNIAARICGNNVPLFNGIKKLRKLKKKICL